MPQAQILLARKTCTQPRDKARELRGVERDYGLIAGHGCCKTRGMQNDQMAVSELMSTSVVSIKTNDTIDLADLEMSAGRMRHLPVVDDSNNLVGIVSNRDILGAHRKGKQTQIGSIMNTELVSVSENDPAYQAAAIMLENKIGALPVLGADGQMVGIVTETDFLEVAYKSLRR